MIEPMFTVTVRAVSHGLGDALAQMVPNTDRTHFTVTLNTKMWMELGPVESMRVLQHELSHCAASFLTGN